MANQKNIDKELWDACNKKDLIKVKALLLCGGNPWKRIEGKSTAPIHEAVWYDDDFTDILKAIIACTSVKDMAVGNRPYNLSPLLRACKHGNIQCAKILLENGADVTATSTQGESVLHYAAFSGNPLMVEDCLKWNSVNVNERGWKDKTALIKASKLGHVDIVHVLLSAGADVTLKDDDGYTAAWYARNKKEIAEMIVNHQEKHEVSNSRTVLPTAFVEHTLSSSSAANQNIATVKSIIKKVFPDFNEEKIKFILTTIEDTGHNFQMRSNSNLLFLESSDFGTVLKPLEARVLLNEFKKEFSAEKFVNF